MNNKVLVRFSRDDLMYGEKIDILLSDKCKSIFPMNIVHKDDGITGYYDTLGYKRVSDFEELTVKYALIVAKKVIEAVEDCYQYLLFPDEYVINPNTAYVDHNIDTVKFTFIPDRCSESFNSKYIGFLRCLKGLTTENGCMHLEAIIKYCGSKTISFNKIKYIISRLLQEVES